MLANSLVEDLATAAVSYTEDPEEAIQLVVDWLEVDLPEVLLGQIQNPPRSEQVRKVEEWRLANRPGFRSYPKKLRKSVEQRLELEGLSALYTESTPPEQSVEPNFDSDYIPSSVHVNPSPYFATELTPTIIGNDSHGILDIETDIEPSTAPHRADPSSLHPTTSETSTLTTDVPLYGGSEDNSSEGAVQPNPDEIEQQPQTGKLKSAIGLLRSWMKEPKEYDLRAWSALQSDLKNDPFTIDKDDVQKDPS